MLKQQSSTSDLQHERCESCDRQTAHTVRIELITESKDNQNAEYSKEPYRIASCESCGHTSQLRMNNA